MNSKAKIVTLPIALLTIFILFTFLPILYTFFPFLGKMKIVLLAGIGLLVSYLMTVHKYTNHNVGRNPIFILWLSFVFIMFLGLLGSYDRGLTAMMIEAVIKIVLSVAIMAKIIDSEDRLDLILTVFAFCAVGMALSTIVNYLFIGYTFEETIRGAGIKSGTMADPNDLALFLNSSLPLLFYYVSYSKKRMITLLSVTIVTIAVILTYSRGGFIGLCTVYFGLLVIRKNKRIKSFAILAACAFAFIAFAPNEYMERLSTIIVESKVDENTGEYPGRMQAWISLLPAGMEKPIFGAGAGGSIYIASKNIGDWHLVHNTFLQIFLEMGFVGLSCYLLIYLFVYRQYLRFQRYAYENGMGDQKIEMYKYLILCLVTFAVTAFFLPQAYSPLFFVLSGFVLANHEIMVKNIVRIEKSKTLSLEKIGE